MRFIFGLAAAILISLTTVGAAQAQSAECQRLQQAIASAGRGGGQGAQYEAAAQRQRGEIERTAAYARSLGCENRKFLFFGSNPPPQCDQINGQLSRMQANLGELQSRAGGAGGGRAELVARYNSECAAPQRSGGILEALFGNPRDQPSDVQTLPIAPDSNANPEPQRPSSEGGATEAHAGSKAVCVRSCDGSFFPVSYSAWGGLDELQDMCRALCPNAEVTLYTYSPSADIDQAVSITGARYMDSPTALKYRKSVDNSCSCRRRGQSWAEALAGAEQRLGSMGKTDIMVTPERSAELSRPKLDPKAKATKSPLETPKITVPDPKATAQDQTPIDQLLGQQAATVSRESSGIAGGDAATGPLYTKGQGQTQEITGPDGVKRRVRIIDPTL